MVSCFGNLCEVFHLLGLKLKPQRYTDNCFYDDFIVQVFNNDKQYWQIIQL